MIKDDYSCPQSARIGLGRIEAGAEADMDESKFVPRSKLARSVPNIWI